MDSSRTENTFKALRHAPVEIPLEKTEAFIIASAATGAFSIGMFPKLALKFHLNTIIAMTSTVATTAVAGLLVFHTSVKAPKTHTAFFHPVKHTTTPAVNNTPPLLPALLTRTFVYNDTPAVPQKNKYVTYTYSYSGNGDSVLVQTLKTDNMLFNDTVAFAQLKDAEQELELAQSLDHAQLAFDIHDSELAALDHDLARAQLVLDMRNAELAELARNSALVALSADSLSYAYAFASSDLSAPGFAWCDSGNSFNGHSRMSGNLTGEFHTDTLKEVIEKTLIKDALISDPKHYSFSIDGNSLKINGKKQSNATWEKYKMLIETNSPNKVDHSFSYALKVSGENMVLNVENYVN